jgi:hypothetical protein
MPARLTKDTVNERIADRGIRLIGEYVNNRTKTLFQCSEGHRWEATPGAVMSVSGCPHCAGVVPLSKQVVNQRIADRGIRLIGEYVNNQAKTLFQCSEGHNWEAPPNGVMRGTGCPHCADTASDNNAIYLWKAQGETHNNKQVYKVGITSARLEAARVNDVARASGFTPEIVALEPTTGPASMVEALLLQLGDHPGYEGFDGASEFRAMSAGEYLQALDIIEHHAA